MAQTSLLALPGELRNRIYAFVVVNDMEAFVEHMAQPAVLRTCHQLRSEYSEVFFGSAVLQIDAYHGGVAAWQSVRRCEDKRCIFEHAVLTDLLHFWSLASARRYCQRVYSDLQGNVQTGIMTMRTRAGIKRWQWSMAIPD